MATMMAGKVAGVMAQKIEHGVEQNLEQKLAAGPPPTCQGPECCLGSTCMNMPGMHCDEKRGAVICEGSSMLNMKEGVCRCLHGPCDSGGICLEAESSGGAAFPPLTSPAYQQAAPAYQQVSDAPGGAAAQDAPSAAGPKGWGASAQSGSSWALPLPLPVMVGIGAAIAALAVGAVVWNLGRRCSSSSRLSCNKQTTLQTTTTTTNQQQNNH
ncbi:unnamed protein product [Polarella glacialis]|uniref:Uncharacterized protein n=1 Tax=Polarella glacialis TaxID=89957 RepID=A0A813DMS9_POLGL|nr:unnamed protein product [Polarella glacialis]